MHVSVIITLDTTHRSRPNPVCVAAVRYTYDCQPCNEKERKIPFSPVERVKTCSSYTGPGWPEMASKKVICPAKVGKGGGKGRRRKKSKNTISNQSSRLGKSKSQNIQANICVSSLSLLVKSSLSRHVRRFFFY